MPAESGSAIGRWAPVALWATVIFTASTSWFAGSNTEPALLPLRAWLLPGVDRHTLQIVHAGLRKRGHFTVYLFLGVLVTRALRTPSGWRLRHSVLAIGLATSYAITDEFHQHFVPGRTAAVGDVAIDALGAIAGQLGLAVGRARRRS